jgi:hypothetical protein
VGRFWRCSGPRTESKPMPKPDPSSNEDVKTANLALMALIGLFAFVVLFIFFSMNMEMMTRSDLPPSSTTARHDDSN